ncbi:MAG TPA: hypothetical protein DCP51_05820, partial [Clostridiales bacterium]|nr:hypothetical protein [Clostridiales bacterium]
EENNEDSYEAGSGKEAADSTGLDSGLGLEEISDVSEYDAESYVLTPDNQNEEKIKVSLKSEMVTQDDTFCVELIFGEDVSDYYFVTDTISVIKDDYKVNGNKAEISMISDDNDIKSLDLELLAKDEFSMLEIYIDLGDGEYQRKIIFAYTTDGMTFVSDVAEDDAWNKALC